MHYLLIVLACLVLLPISTLAETWHVNPGGTGDFPDIQSAVDAAADDDEILLADGVFSGLGNYRVNFRGKAITVRSASGVASACVIDCGWGWGFDFANGEGPSSVLADVTILTTSYSTLYHGVRVDGTSPTIRGVTFRSTYYAIWSEGGSPRLEDSILENGCNLFFRDGASPVVTGCVLEAGSLVESRGRVRVYESSLRFEDCSLDDEDDWGGVVIWNSSSEIVGCEFSNTRLYVDGDGVSVLLEDCQVTSSREVYLRGTGSDFVVRDCTLHANYEEGIEASGDSHVTVEGCDIRGNGGVGVRTYGSQVTLRGCLIAGNDDGGVAVWPSGSPFVFVSVEDCTIASNGGVTYWGGGLFLGGNVDASVTRTILWGNCGSFGPDAWIHDGNLQLDCVNVDLSRIGGDGTVQVVGDILGETPLFCEPIDCTQVPFTGGDFTLWEDSPAYQHACGSMGGQGSGCGAISVTSASWGTIKALYR